LPLAGVDGAIPDPERILQLHSDAVVAWRIQSEALRKTGYPGLVELEYLSRRSLFDIWTRLSEVVGREGRARALWDDAEATQRELQDALPPTEKASVLPAVPSAAGWWIGGRNYELNALLEHVGAFNPAWDLFVSGTVDAEEILRFDPDVIVIPSFSDEAAPGLLYSDPRWQALRAVHQRRIYLMPVSSLFNAPVDETLLLIWLGEVLHPSLSRMTRAAYHKSYARAYYYDLSDDEIDDALFMKENAESVGYARFARETGASSQLTLQDDGEQGRRSTEIRRPERCLDGRQTR